MKILVLSPYPRRLTFLPDDEIERTEGPITPSQAARHDMLVSYGYRHVLKPDVLAACPAVNLHISYLPWNRGADPNLWSWVDGTPKGVTIHVMDEGVDTGPILVQRAVSFYPDETLTSSYHRLCADIEDLFATHWPLIREGRIVPKPQGLGGTSHRKAERPELPDGWTTPIRAFAEWAYDARTDA